MTAKKTGCAKQETQERQLATAKNRKSRLGTNGVMFIKTIVMVIAISSHHAIAAQRYARDS